MLKTLIVEDNAAFRRSLSELLRAAYPAMMVAQAESIGEAWQKIAEIEPRLIFVDIKLQQENGLDLALAIRESYPEIIVVVVTGYNIPEYRHAAYQNGAHYFIPKDALTSPDILALIDSVQGGQPPQWSLGSDFVNPSYPGFPKKK